MLVVSTVKVKKKGFFKMYVYDFRQVCPWIFAPAATDTEQNANGIFAVRILGFTADQTRFIFKGQ